MIKKLLEGWNGPSYSEADLVIINDNSSFRSRRNGIERTARVFADFQQMPGVELPQGFPISEEQIKSNLLKLTDDGKHGAGGIVDVVIGHYTQHVSFQEFNFLGEKSLGRGNYVGGHLNPQTHGEMLAEIISRYKDVELKVVNSSGIQDLLQGKPSPKDHEGEEQIIVCSAAFPKKYWKQIVPHPKKGRQEVLDEGEELMGVVLNMFFKDDWMGYLQTGLFCSRWDVLEDRLRSTAQEFSEAGIPTRVLYLNERG